MKRNGELRGVAIGEGSNGVEVDPCWKNFWGMQIPPRACVTAPLHEETLGAAPETVTNNDQVWTKPQQGWTKMNTDAAWVQGTGFGAGGAVCRDSNGNFLGASCWKLEGAGSPLMAETLALRGGVEFAYYNQWRNIEIESDSKQLINMLTGRQRVEVIMGDIQYLTVFMEVKFHHITRTSNNVAHTLAHWVHSGTRDSTWISYPPYLFLMPLSHDL
ncbi:hypothetical protein LIER_15268 [Lithospermum erythrorhizon]|uniref:RNase H type-1 domain-containing protein n=1 Tax=Lithospermum erythrorhizon TaxID=34254 RepID=A0AAV3Q4J2_LITER